MNLAVRIIAMVYESKLSVELDVFYVFDYLGHLIKLLSIFFVESDNFRDFQIIAFLFLSSL